MNYELNGLECRIRSELGHILHRLEEMRGSSYSRATLSNIDDKLECIEKKIDRNYHFMKDHFGKVTVSDE